MSTTPKNRTFNDLHHELMDTNSEYKTLWLQEYHSSKNLHFMQCEFMTMEEIQAAFESKNEERRDCLRQEMVKWRVTANLDYQEIADRMGVSATTVRRIETNPLNATMNSIARFAYACGYRVSLDRT